MKQANLLIEQESFIWNDVALDRSSSIEDFMLAHNQARSAECCDRIFNAPNFWLLEAEGGNFIETITSHQKATTIFPWLKPDHRTFLVRQIMNYGTTPNMSSTLAELESEEGFVEENNGMLQIGETEEAMRVFDINSWFNLHINYIKRFPTYINWELNDTFPYFEYSNLHIFKLVKQHTEDFSDENEMLEYFQNVLIRTLRANAGDLIELACEIANRNGYQQNHQLSSQEAQLRKSRRLIFEVLKQENNQYLSLDFENGQFEVCDGSGKHIGVFNFSGKVTGVADSSGDHDIWTLRR